MAHQESRPSLRSVSRESSGRVPLRSASVEGFVKRKKDRLVVLGIVFDEMSSSTCHNTDGVLSRKPLPVSVPAGTAVPRLLLEIS